MDEVFETSVVSAIVLERLADVKEKLVTNVVLLPELAQVEQVLVQLRLRSVIVRQDRRERTGYESEGSYTGKHDTDAVDAF